MHRECIAHTSTARSVRARPYNDRTARLYTDYSLLSAKKGFLLDNDTLDTIIIGGPTYYAIDVEVGGHAAHAGMEPEKLKERYGDRLTFWGGGVDTQHVLPFGTRQEVQDEVKRRLDDLGPGGGFGRLARKYGLALDNVTGVDIVTADGQLRHASATENPDLYWAVRGGGGNFGVVTTFQFKLHPHERTVIGGDVIYPLSDLPGVLAFYADYAVSAPDELYLDFFCASEPGTEEGVCGLHACWSGAPSAAEKVLAPIYQAGTVINDGIGATDYVAIQRSWDNTDPRHTASYLKSGFVNAIPDQLVSTIAQNFKTFNERGTTMFFQHSGGAIGRVPTDATAFAHRKSVANMFAVVEWPLGESRDSHVAYIKDYWRQFEPFTDGWYTNEVDDHAAATVNRNYQGNYERLVQVKNRYDPTNLFRLNANVIPTV